MIQKNQITNLFKKTFGLNSRLAAAIGITCLLNGCAVFGTSLESPHISLSNLAMQESTGFETAFQIQLRVLNPNDSDLNIQGVDCTLEINGKPFAYGISKAAVQVPAFDSASVPVTVYASAFGIARGLFDMQQRDEMSYQLKGKVRLENTGWLSSKLPFKSEGTISLKDLQDKALH